MELKGEIKEIIFQNEINSYTIAVMETEFEELTVVGYLPFITLGDSLKLIAGEKAGIIKHRVPCVTCAQDPEAMSVIIDGCADSSAPISMVEPTDIVNVTVGYNGTDFKYKGVCYTTSLIGAHQAENAALAIETILCLNECISVDVINKGLIRVKHPARIEVFNKERPIIIDGAHNPDGAESLAAFLRKVEFDGCMIFGGMKDKNLDEVARILASYPQKIITVTVENNPRAQTAEQLKTTFYQYNPNVYAAKSYEEAIKMIDGNSTLICGSLYLAADMRKYFDKT